jgi:hypothetical protein
MRRSNLMRAITGVAFRILPFRISAQCASTDCRQRLFRILLLSPKCLLQSELRELQRMGRLPRRKSIPVCRNRGGFHWALRFTVSGPPGRDLRDRRRLRGKRKRTRLPGSLRAACFSTRGQVSAIRGVRVRSWAYEHPERFVQHVVRYGVRRRPRLPHRSCRCVAFPGRLRVDSLLRRASGQRPGIDRHRFPFLMKD